MDVLVGLSLHEPTGAGVDGFTGPSVLVSCSFLWFSAPLEGSHFSPGEGVTAASVA